jgi:hypothetical protein
MDFGLLINRYRGHQRKCGHLGHGGREIHLVRRNRSFLHLPIDRAQREPHPERGGGCSHGDNVGYIPRNHHQHQ